METEREGMEGAPFICHKSFANMESDMYLLQEIRLAVTSISRVGKSALNKLDSVWDVGVE